MGEHDVIAPVGESRRIHQLVSNSKLVVIRGAGHLILYEKPRELNLAILEFVKELS